MRNFGILFVFLFSHGWTEGLRLFEECDGIRYDSSKEVCCNDILYQNTKHTECCFGDIIDTRLYFCFIGKLLNPVTNCNDKFYDYELEFCCHKQIVPYGKGLLCCDTMWLYDPKVHTCDMFGEGLQPV